MTDNLHTARVEAAARRMWLDRNGTIGMWDAPKSISGVVKEHYRAIASNALNAADNLVTVEKIAEVLHREATDDGEVHVLWGGAAEHEAEVAEWMPYARAVHALLAGEEA